MAGLLVELKVVLMVDLMEFLMVEHLVGSKDDWMVALKAVMMVI